MLQTRWSEEKGKQVSECFDWESIDQDYVLNEVLTNVFMDYGSIYSVSPSGQFGLFGKPSSDKQQWNASVINLDSFLCKDSFQLPSSSFNTPFSCFQWSQDECSISYFILLIVTRSFVCEDRDRLVEEDEIRQPWLVDTAIYHCCIYWVTLGTHDIKVACISSFIPRSLLLPVLRTSAMVIMCGMVNSSMH